MNFINNLAEQRLLLGKSFYLLYYRYLILYLLHFQDLQNIILNTEMPWLESVRRLRRLGSHLSQVIYHNYTQLSDCNEIKKAAGIKF